MKIAFVPSARQLRLLTIGGLAIGMLGFLWGGLSAGIPYQDATPEQESSFALHANVAFGLMCLGFVLFLVGVVGRIVGPAPAR